jgi:hypothetical protein
VADMRAGRGDAVEIGLVEPHAMPQCQPRPEEPETIDMIEGGAAAAPQRSEACDGVALPRGVMSLAGGRGPAGATSLCSSAGDINAEPRWTAPTKKTDRRRSKTRTKARTLELSYHWQIFRWSTG